MKLLIIGAGRMGVRHAQGALNVTSIAHITMVDISSEALASAQEALSKNAPAGIALEFLLLSDFEENLQSFDVCIIASTASNRKATLDMVEKTKCAYVLVEKPLGQSKSEVEDLLKHTTTLSAKVAVNLNMRLYDNFIALKKTLHEVPQYQGEKVISLNIGSVGIGANGIHYLDLCTFLLDADRTELVAGEIEPVTLPSGRGAEFGDFGGWCTIKFYKGDTYQGRAHLSITAQSSAFGGWQIICPNARIAFNEVEQAITHQVRKADSQLPVYRYAADYEAPQKATFAAPFLGDLTAKWLDAIAQGEQILPSIENALQAHELMFQWLSLSTTHQEVFPIT